ncbi:MAG: DUF362 domain-containing protein [Thermoguttaceae bacterium]|nr:DUF362 domain-containing protein [Thermoguttaceae bacterium]
MEMTRKDFLKAVALAGMTTTFSSAAPFSVLAQQGKNAAGADVDLVALMGGEPGPMFEKGIEVLGGMKRFVDRGAKVVIKPNIGWDKKPELAANTNPELVVAMINAAKDCGAKEIVVFDNTCDNWRRSYENSGIEAAAKKAGAVVVPANEERYYREVSLPKAKVLKKAKIHEEILDCDVWFNAPILKNHGGAKMTIAMKNLMGIVWDRREFHTLGLDQTIADIGLYEKPACLNVVDAYRAMKANGPRGLNEADVVTPKCLFMSTDPVAVDVAAIRTFNQFQNMPLENVRYVAMAEELKLGVSDLSKLKVERVKM